MTGHRNAAGKKSRAGLALLVEVTRGKKDQRLITWLRFTDSTTSHILHIFRISAVSAYISAPRTKNG